MVNRAFLEQQPVTYLIQTSRAFLAVHAIILPAADTEAVRVPDVSAG